MDYHLTFKKNIKNGVTRLINLQEGLIIIPYFLYEVILHYKRKKRKKKKNCYKCPPLNRPWSSGSKVWHAKHKPTMSSHVRLEITVHNPSFGHICILKQGKWHFTLGQNRRFFGERYI